MIICKLRPRTPKTPKPKRLRKTPDEINIFREYSNYASCGNGHEYRSDSRDFSMY